MHNMTWFKYNLITISTTVNIRMLQSDFLNLLSIQFSVYSRTNVLMLRTLSEFFFINCKLHIENPRYSFAETRMVALNREKCFPQQRKSITPNMLLRINLESSFLNNWKFQNFPDVLKDKFTNFESMLERKISREI